MECRAETHSVQVVQGFAYMLQANMASAMEISQRELGFAGGKAVICVTGSLHAISAAQQYVS